jgi:hypothetical protein
MNNRFLNRELRLLVVLLVTFAGAYAQRPAPQTSTSVEADWKASSYLFVSPNTRENLTLKESLKLLDSPEELRLLRRIRRLSLCLGLKPMILKTVGSWSDGAEHAALFRIYSDQATVRYTDARLGKRERQKSVLYFRRNSSGLGRMYVLYARRRKSGLAGISRVLDQNGVAYRTLVPGRRRLAIVYVVDLKDELQKQVSAAARELGARLLIIKGEGEFIGDDSDRDKAQTVFAAVIEEYEAAHPQVSRQCSQN